MKSPVPNNSRTMTSRAAADIPSKQGDGIQLKQPETGIDFSVPGMVQRKAVSAPQVGGQGIVQAKLLRYKPAGAPKTASEHESHDAAKSIDGAVIDAHNKVSKGDYTGASEGHINIYKRRLVEGQTSLARAAAGYLIEDIASKKAKADFGAQIELQNATLMAGTRPDLVFNAPSGGLGLIDITSLRQTGHILKKKGNWLKHKHIPYVAESIYPTVQLDGSVKSLTDADFKMAQKQAEQTLKHKKQREKMLAKSEKFKGSRFGGVLGKRGKSKGATAGSKKVEIKKFL